MKATVDNTIFEQYEMKKVKENTENRGKKGRGQTAVTPRQEERAEKTDRLTQQWGVERVVLLVAVGTQDTFDLHVWGHEWGRGHFRQKLLPWLLAGGAQVAQVQCVGNINAHI